MNSNGKKIEHDGSDEDGADLVAGGVSHAHDNKLDSRMWVGQRYSIMTAIYIALIPIFILFYVVIFNRSAFILSEENVVMLRNLFNAFVFLSVAFVFGLVGAVSRVIFSGERIIHSVWLIVGSGMMASFSWVGIKSGVLMAIIAPHIEQQSGVPQGELTRAPDDFYTLILVAILVGMFSTNLYIYINQRVEQITKKQQNQSGESG